MAADPARVGRLPAAGAADRAIAGRVGLAAGRAGRDGAFAAPAHELGPQGDGLHGTDGRPGRADLLAQAVTVLLLLGLQFEEPLTDGRVRLQAGGVHRHPHALAGPLVEEGHGVQAEIEDPQPSVAHGAGGEHLHGVGQAPGRL